MIFRIPSSAACFAQGVAEAYAMPLRSGLRDHAVMTLPTSCLLTLSPLDLAVSVSTVISAMCQAGEYAAEWSEMCLAPGRSLFRIVVIGYHHQFRLGLKGIPATGVARSINGVRRMRHDETAPQFEARRFRASSAARFVRPCLRAARRFRAGVSMREASRLRPTEQCRIIVDYGHGSRAARSSGQSG